MKVLFIDLASHDRLFALVDGTKTVASVAIEDQKAEAALMPAIESLLKKAGWTYADLTRVAAVHGPGGFMTLRAGISLANALSWSLKIPSAAAHLSDLWRERVDDDRDFIWLHSTKKTHVFIRGFGMFAKQWPEAALIAIDELRSIKKRPQWVGELIPEHRELVRQWKRIGTIRPVTDVLPQMLASLKFVSEQTLLPWYGRGA